ncbi:MAG: class II fructose-bisphosphate aldolase, partial [Clostridia bacterium]|nr:class II fructose-bisphosphate aldolase [Clostridia bacterium]
ARLEWEKFEAQSLEAVASEYFRHCKPTHTLLHLDHVPVIDEDDQRVDYLPIIQRALDAGYQSVMVDGSRLPLIENIEATRQAAELAHACGAAIEAELGAVAGHEAEGIGMPYEELFASKKGFTNIAEAARFAGESGCDWLSVAVGSVHGAIAERTLHQKKPEARLDIDHIRALHAAADVPLVLHGGSGIRQEYVLEAVRHGIAKINVGTEIRQPYTLALQERSGDVRHALDAVYERTRWVIHDFLKIAGSRMSIG